MTPTLQERRVARTRAEIVQVALDLFDRHGFDAVTAEEIARQANVSPRTFFRYFDTKAALVLEGFGAFAEQLIEQLDAQSAGEPFVDALRRALEAAYLAAGRDALANLRRSCHIMRNAVTVRSAASVAFPEQDMRLAMAVARWVPAKVDPRVGMFAAVSLNLALWMTIEGATDKDLASAQRLAGTTLDLLGAWSQLSAPSLG